MMADQMTDLLSPPHASRPMLDPDGRRPVVVGAVLAAVAAPLSVLVGCLAVALAAWFSSDQGSHGTTTDALRIGADAWLLAHGAHLDLGVATITMVPLALTLLCGVVAFRFGRWAGATSAAEDGAAVGMAAVVLVAVHGLVCLVVALLASVPTAEPSLGRAFLGGALLAGTAGVPGLLVGAGRLDVVERVPSRVRAALRTGAAISLGVVAAGGVLAAAMLVTGLGDAANMLTRLGAGSAGSAFATLVVAGVAPNLALFGASYLVGPGFAVGTGTGVSAGAVTLGPLPAFPVFAALPGPGAPPGWALALLAVPPVVAALVGWSAVRRTPARGYDDAAIRGLSAGAAGGVLLGLALALSGGAIGPGRMTEIGPALLEPTMLAVVSLAVGAALGSVLAHARPVHGADPDAELTVTIPTSLREASDDTEATGPVTTLHDDGEPTVAIAPPSRRPRIWKASAPFTGEPPAPDGD